MYSRDISNELELIKKQFLCCTPLKNFQWGNTLETISWEGQELLCNNTVNCSIVLKYPIKLSYQIVFTKFIIAKLEKEKIEIHDHLYEACSHLLTLAENPTYKHYYIESNNIITLQENLSLISEGTTGLCSWEAAIVLSEWCLDNKNLLYNKSVLELGSGIGLTGLVAALNCQPKVYYFSDCHSSVLNVLCENIKINVPSVCLQTGHTLKTNINSHTELQVLELPWEKITGNNPEINSVEVVLAADVIYDSSLFTYLCGAIEYFLKLSSCKLVLLACAERNKETLKEFNVTLERNSMSFKELKLPEQKHFLWNCDIPVKIFSIFYGLRSTNSLEKFSANVHETSTRSQKLIRLKLENRKEHDQKLRNLQQKIMKPNL